MKIIVVGLGKVGLSIVKALTKEGHDIVGIDIKPDIVEKTINLFDISGICGNGSSYDILKEAGTQNAKLVIATTKQDETNILCCMVAKSIGAKFTVARIREPELEKRQFQNTKENFSIDFAINPEKECAKKIMRMLKFPFANKAESFSNNLVECLQFALPEKCFMVGKMLKNIMKKIESKVIIGFVIRDNKVLVPRGDFKFLANDTIGIVGKNLEVDSFLKEINIVSEKIRSVLIIGGGKITFYLAKMLEAEKQKAKIVESSKEKCQELAENLSKSCIINGDGTDQNLLMQEGFNGVDACVALTGMDEQNILTSLYARKQNIKNIIPKVNKDIYQDILGEINLPNSVSPKDISSNQILRFVRALEVPEDSSIISLYKMANGCVEALEFNVKSNPKFVGKQVKDIDLKQNVLLACIKRERDVFVPNGTTVFCLDDQIVLTTTRSDIKRIEDILA